MSLPPPSRRLVRSGLRFTHYPPPQTRTIFSWLRSQKKTTPSDPMATDYTKQKPTSSLPAPSSTTHLPGSGDLAPNSIFSDTPETSSTEPSTRSPPQRRRDPSLMAMALDPTPRARRRWERKILIRSIRTRFRLSKTTRILRTERSSLTKSPMYRTSIKKLGPLARQIAGKTVDDAIIQMRFSKKKVAADVLQHLEYARDEAIVKRGMGLGGVKKAPEVRDEDEGKEVEEQKEIVIRDKKGKKRTIKDKTQIYVDQAWVGRGTYSSEPDYRARGQVYEMRPPTTSITVLLKEEATRLRLAAEREQKLKRRKPWVPLPDRPVTAQRQYCMW